MPRFPSDAWASAFRERLNADAAYARAAAAWEGDVLFWVTPDATAPRGEGVHLDLAHGSCRAARWVDDAEATRAEFTYSGSREAWGRMLRREIDPVRAILDGTFRLRGNLLKAMRFTGAAKAMVEAATLVPVGD
jgi:putative sterol carrier protein